MSLTIPPILLASSSPYRAAMLQQLGLVFDTYSPNIDESALVNEQPQQLAERLSIEKARAAQSVFPDSLIIASDQVACMDASAQIIGKPYTQVNAIKQLTQYSGNTLHFYTALSVFAPTDYGVKHQVQTQHTLVETYSVTFRQLSQRQIERYIQIEQPLDCAGSFKAEGLGISLFERFSGRDYNTLIGLPLMALVETFQALHIDILDLPLSAYGKSHGNRLNG